jgi:hypothetical protein
MQTLLQWTGESWIAEFARQRFQQHFWNHSEEAKERGTRGIRDPTAIRYGKNLPVDGEIYPHAQGRCRQTPMSSFQS